MASVLTWTLNEKNDEKVNFVLTTNDPTDGTILNLTGMTVEVYLKAGKAASDTDGATWKGSTATTGVTVTDAPNGKCYAQIPAASVTTSMTWLRVDVLDGGGLRKTACYGVVTVNDT